MVRCRYAVCPHVSTVQLQTSPCLKSQGTKNTRQYVYNVDLKLSGAATTIAVTTAPGDSATTHFAMRKTLTSDARRSSDTGLFINHLSRTVDTTVASNTFAPCTISCSRSVQIRQGMALCRTLGREASECNASDLVEVLCKRVIGQSTHHSFDNSVRS